MTRKQSRQPRRPAKRNSLRRAEGRPAFPRYQSIEPLELRVLLSSINTLASFSGTNGSFPLALIQDSHGNIFGTATAGAANDDGCVFEIPAGNFTINDIASFNGTNGSGPNGSLIVDANGDLFGTTFLGGASNSGVVYEIASGSNTITTLASFNGTNGTSPQSDLVRDSNGNLFGTANGGVGGDGVIFEVANNSGTITILASFNGTDGIDATSLAIDAAGNLFGAANTGGPSNFGTVFEVPQGTGNIVTLASFGNSTGQIPQGGILLDGNDDVFGTTKAGGTNNDGTVFELASGSGTLTTLASFDGNNGSLPLGPIVRDPSGNIFGTANTGGINDQGTVFELPNGGNTLLPLAFFTGDNGANPEGGLVLDVNLKIYSTTTIGGSSDNGTLFRLATPGPAVVPDSISMVHGTVYVTGTTGSDTIAGGLDPADASQYYFLISSPGLSTDLQVFPTSQVTGVQINDDPYGAFPTGADNDLVNLGGANFGFPVHINGGAGSDTIIGQQSPNIVSTGVGSSRDIIYGGVGSDSIVSQGSNDTMRSGGGHDTIRANTGNNVLVGGKDGSRLWAGNGHDTLRAGAGESTLHGGGGGSLLLGGFGNDVLDAGSGLDTIMAGTGHSTLIGGASDDFLDAGWDAFLILQGGSPMPAASGSDLVDGSAGISDTLVASSGTPTLVGGSGNSVFAVNDPAATLQNVGSSFVAQNDTVASATNLIKVHLTIQDSNGGVIRDVVIPNGAGAAPSGTSAAMATSPNGRIYFQSNGARTFTLGDFFNHWGVDFNALGIGQFIASSGSGHSLSMTVNGVANSSFNNYVVQNNDNIVITFTQ